MKLPKNRWGAFAAHFGISLLIFFALLGVILLLWYPGALFTAAGGWQGIRIVVGVDLVLGPLLTLIVYNLAKPRRLLYRDLLIVGVIQLSCLAAGVLIVYVERPVAVIYSLDKFYALKRCDFVANGKDPQQLQLRLMSPLYHQVDLGAGSRAEAELINKINMLAGKNLLFRTDLYKPIPREMAEAGKVINFETPPPSSSCPKRSLQVELLTAYAEGTACFDPARQRFAKFIRK
jgi:hypothetical protein